MKSRIIQLEESVALRLHMLQFVEENIDKLKHIYENFDKIVFVKDVEQKKSLEIFKIEGHLKLLLPQYRYLVVGGDTFNNLLLKEKVQQMYHILAHIPRSFSGNLLDHDGEYFVGEAKLFSKKDGRTYIMAGEWHEPDTTGQSRPKGGSKENFIKINQNT